MRNEAEAMIVQQARETARVWVMEESARLPGFAGAYTAGSANWLPDDAALPATSDFDIMVAVAEPRQAGARRKFLYRDVLLEVSYLGNDRLRSPVLLLSDYHLAPSFRTAHILLDPSGNLTALQATVRRDYAKRQWVGRRCAHARAKVRESLRSIREGDPVPDRVMAGLFAAGITTHVLLAAGLMNPTVRARYTAVRELLAGYGRLEFHETLLELLGSTRIERGLAERHLATLAEIFDAARREIRTAFPFASDISESARPLAIEASLETIARGGHREAMFWIAVTHSRCQKVLLRDAPGQITRGFRDSYRELLGDLGVASFAETRRRAAEIERSLPGVWEMAEAIMAANPEIEEG